MPHPIPPLETSRLLLRGLEMEDAPQIQAIFPQWKVVKYLIAKIPWPYPANGAETFVRERVLPAHDRGESWFWSIRLKSEPAILIGVINLTKVGEDHRGFWLAPSHHGRGYMTEACDAVTDFWFEVLKMPVLRAPKAAENVASRRISERQGMRLIGQTEKDYVSGRLLSELWEITAEEWRARKAERLAARNSRT
jgi:[ribosomal protein S5]-alanine N-acetyltransferase